jgi:AraC-like DNA-binding protein
MLRFSNETVAEIAAKTGFCDIYYFSRAFKKNKGMSPLQYRKMKLD